MSKTDTGCRGTAHINRVNTAKGNHRIMAEVTIVYWRDIPAQVIAKHGRQSAKRELPARFAEALSRVWSEGELLPTAPVRAPKVLGLVAPYRPNASRDKSFDTLLVPAENVALRTTSQLLIASPLLTKQTSRRRPPLATSNLSVSLVSNVSRPLAPLNTSLSGLKVLASMTSRPSKPFMLS